MSVFAVCPRLSPAAASGAAADSASDPAIFKAIDSAARAEVEDKQFPSLTIAVVDRNGIRWSQAYGFEDAGKTRPATIDSIYRVGGIPQALTDLLVGQLVKAGKLDLDRPIEAYLPDFKPVNPFGGAITLRMLMAHTSGLVREAPVGNYWASDKPSLAASVLSVSKTTLVAKPGTTTKYSNAGLAVVARTLEVATGQSYDQLIRGRLLEPLGMRASTLERGSLKPKVPVYAELVPFDSTRFAAPEFDIGEAPAGGLYTSVRDSAQFARMLIGHGALDGHPIVDRALLTDLSAKGGRSADSAGLAHGSVGSWQTLECAGHVYGFSSSVLAAPEQGVAVVVLGALDGSPSASRLSHYAMKVLAQARASQAVPAWARSSAFGNEARALQGVFRRGNDSLVLRVVGGKLYLEAPTVAAEVRHTEDGRLVLDDAGTFESDLRISGDHNKVVLSGSAYERTAVKEPPPPAAAIQEIIGDYGWPHGYLRIYERDRRAYARTTWSTYQLLTAAGKDTWTLPPGAGPYALESIRFERDAHGKIQAASLSGVTFPRRDFGAESEAALRSSMRPIAALRAEARAARPPVEKGPKRPVELEEITSRMPGILLDIRYATTNDFMKAPVYTQARAFLQRPAVEALQRAAASLATKGFGLTIHDGYRPWFVTKMFWDATPDYNHIFVADPSQGSRHNRGCAVDLTMHDLKSGHIVQMTGRYDEMSSRSFPQYVGGTSQQRWRRDLLREAMEAQGFLVYDAEWWHFDFGGWQDFPISNLEFSEIGR